MTPPPPPPFSVGRRRRRACSESPKRGANQEEILAAFGFFRAICPEEAGPWLGEIGVRPAALRMIQRRARRSAKVFGGDEALPCHAGGPPTVQRS